MCASGKTLMQHFCSARSFTAAKNGAIALSPCGIGIAPTICTKLRSPLIETVSGPTITYARFGNATIGARNASVKCEWFA